MAALCANWNQLRHVRIDRANYDIGVKQREDGRFSVAWVCLTCCEQGPPAPAAETFERAIAFAYIGLRAHHALMHADTRRNLAINGLLESRDVVEVGDFAASDRRQTAYERVKVAFAELCTPHTKVLDSDPQDNGSKNADNSSFPEHRDWSEIAFEFDEALEAYSNEVGRHAKELSKSRVKSLESRA